MARCPICAKEFSAQEYGGRIQANMQFRSHILVSHLQYVRFMRLWNFLVAVPIFIALVAVPLLSRSILLGTIPLIASIMIISFAVWLRSRKISEYRSEWTERPVIDTSVEPSPQLSGPIASDESILQATSSLSQLLSVAPFSPSRIQWIDYIVMPRGGSIRVEADKPIIGKTITLPLRFKDQLTTDEWRPLLSSMLITRAWQRRTRLWVLLLAVAIAVAVNLAVYFLLSPPPSIEPTIAFLIVLLSLPVTAVGLSPLLKKELLEADKQTASTPGTNNLLQVLQKLEAAGEDQSRPRMSPYGKPSIKRRIENLNSTI